MSAERMIRRILEGTSLRVEDDELGDPVYLRRKYCATVHTVSGRDFQTAHMELMPHDGSVRLQIEAQGHHSSREIYLGLDRIEAVSVCWGEQA